MLKKQLQYGASLRGAVKELQQFSVTKRVHVLDPLETGMGIAYTYVDVQNKAALDLLTEPQWAWARLTDGTTYRLQPDDNGNDIWLSYGKRDLSLLPYVVGANKEDVISLMDSEEGYKQPAFIVFPVKPGGLYVTDPSLEDGYTVELKSSRYAEQYFVGGLAAASGGAVSLSARFGDFETLLDTGSGIITGPGRFPVKLQFNSALNDAPEAYGAWSIVQADSFFQSDCKLEWPAQYFNATVETFTSWSVPVAGWLTPPSMEGLRCSLLPDQYYAMYEKTIELPAGEHLLTGFGLFVVNQITTARLPGMNEFEGCYIGTELSMNTMGEGKLTVVTNNPGIAFYDVGTGTTKIATSITFKQCIALHVFKLSPTNMWHLITDSRYIESSV